MSSPGIAQQFARDGVALNFAGAGQHAVHAQHSEQEFDAATLDDALTAMRKDGTLTKISEKWFAADITSK